MGCKPGRKRVPFVQRIELPAVWIILITEGFWLSVDVDMLERLRTITVILILLALASQSVAAVTVTCSMIDSGAAPEMASGASDHMHHSNHEMSASSEEVEKQAGCCGKNLCDASQCAVTHFVVLNSVTQLSAGLPPGLHSEYLFTYYHPESSSIFRPPISR